MAGFCNVSGDDFLSYEEARVYGGGEDSKANQQGCQRVVKELSLIATGLSCLTRDDPVLQGELYNFVRKAHRQK